MLLNLNEQNLLTATDFLVNVDPALAQIVQQYGYPPLWAREHGFSSLVHIILEQQVSLESAKAAFDRLQKHIGDVLPSKFMAIDDENLLKIGFSRQKKRYVRALATAVIEADFIFEQLPALPDHLVREEMKRLKGIGDWTADIYLLFCLLRPDVLPKGDIALYEAIKSLKSLDKRPGYPEFVSLTEHWRPWRSVGARLLWHFYLCERGRGYNTN